MNELGTIYDQWSVSRERALDHLGDLLRAVGFAVRKKSPTESTLRVYPRGHNTYPLLNPRFYESGSEFGLLSERPSLVFDVLSKNQSETWSQRLAAFTADDRCTFQSTGKDSASGYRHHGHFILPLSVDNTSGRIEWSELKEPLARMLRFLEA